MIVMLVTVAVFDTLFAGGCPAEFTTQKTFQGLLHSARCTCGGLDAELLEELDGPATHAAAEHDIGVLLLDEARHLAGLVAIIERILDDFDGFDFSSIDVDQSKERTTAKVMSYKTF